MEFGFRIGKIMGLGLGLGLGGQRLMVVLCFQCSVPLTFHLIYPYYVPLHLLFGPRDTSYTILLTITGSPMI